MQPFRLRISNRQMKTICRQMEDWSIYRKRSEKERVSESLTKHKGEQAKSTWRYKPIRRVKEV